MTYLEMYDNYNCDIIIWHYNIFLAVRLIIIFSNYIFDS